MARPKAKPDVELVWVEATERGHDNVTIREPGDRFQMPKDMEPTWFKPADPPEE